MALAACLTALAAALTGCGSDSSTGPGAGPVPDTPQSELPGALVGSWRYGKISPTNFWDDHTGQYLGNAYGFGDFITFTQDGRFTRLVYIYTNSYGCQTQVWTQMQGTATAEEGTFTLYATQGKYKVADNCVASRNYERPMQPEEVADHQGGAFTWALTQDGGRTYLEVNVPGSTDAPAHYESEQ